MVRVKNKTHKREDHVDQHDDKLWVWRDAVQNASREEYHGHCLRFWSNNSRTRIGIGLEIEIGIECENDTISDNEWFATAVCFFYLRLCSSFYLLISSLLQVFYLLQASTWNRSMVNFLGPMGLPYQVHGPCQHRKLTVALSKIHAQIAGTYKELLRRSK
jgi:hypothetical protein